MADISSIKLPNGTTYNIKDSTARSAIPTKVSQLTNDSNYYSEPTYGIGTADPITRPLVETVRANRLAFLPASQIIIEQTTDGGTTWTDAGVSDSVKVGLFAGTRPTVYLPLLNNARSTNCGLRVTITAMRYNVPSGTAETQKYNYWNSSYVASQERYCSIDKFWFWISAAGDRQRIKVEAASGASPNTWYTRFNTDFGANGWSGSDWVKCTYGTFGGSTNQTGNYWNWRITFFSRMADGASAFTQTSKQAIHQIMAYGENVWVGPNNLMKTDRLYAYDANQNATFPAKVTATTFSGSATLTGTPTAPTASAGTNNTQIATTAFVKTAIDNADLWEQGVDANDQPVAGAIKSKDFTSDDTTYTNTASGVASLAFGGDNNVTANFGVGIGYNNTISGGGSVAIGYSNTAGAGTYAFVAGVGNQATGNNSVAFGYYNQATNYNAFAEGRDNIASGNSAHAEGYGVNIASGQASHAEGRQTTASGSRAHAEGVGTTASGNNSHSQGSYTIANSKSQMVFGEYNSADPGFTAANARGTYVEIVGNGADAQNLSNARTLDWNGNEWVAGLVSVGSSSTPPTPTANNHLTTKKYVDDIVGNIETLLASI